jgi:integrase
MMSAAVEQHQSEGTEDALPEPFTSGKFSDDTWQLFSAAADRTQNILWGSTKFDDGSSLTSPQNTKLLVAAKTYILLFSRELEGDGHPAKAGTILAQLDYLRSLLSWLAKTGLSSFRDITLDHVRNYSKYIRNCKIKLSRAEKREGKLAPKLSSRSQAGRLSLISRLVAFQDKMGELGTAFTKSQSFDLSAMLYVKVRTTNKTSVIPDEIFRKLLDAAVLWMSTEVPKIRELQAYYDTTRVSLQNYPRIFGKRFAVQKRAFKELCNQLGQRAFALDGSIKIRGTMVPLRKVSEKDLSHLVSVTRAACFVAIAGLTGMKESEVLSLKIGCMTSLKIDDNLSALVLNGLLFKTSKTRRGERAKWVAGYDGDANPVNLAINALQQLPRRRGATGLFASSKQWKESKKERITSCRLKKAIVSFSRVAGVSEWNIKTHQFRKTFARFVARSSSASLFVLMRHFKHQSVLMTERYIDYDPDLLNEVFDAMQELLEERLDSIFGASRLGGLAGQRIMMNNAPFRGAENAEARVRLVKLTLNDPTAYFRITPYGVCIYEEDRAKCLGKEENVGIDTCVGCHNFSTDEHNLPFWIDERDRIQATIEDHRALGFVNLDLCEKLAQAERIIASLSVSNG